ncbi:hypothetical protein UFOVP115_54 [uncultured Caudovirales phage]|uniref:Uncharacterized protein n=1 Tax=uncultured Caudovirales phage TaxID=2100421 RepID=A0A6J5L4C2_9CAUD|nr:hypothetical protein UFOVP115_54 [uncultured Caudovirales phage]
MSKMAELHAEGVTDLVSYTIGIQHGIDMAVGIIRDELTESESPMQGTKGGWRDHLIKLIKGQIK